MPCYTVCQFFFAFIRQRYRYDCPPPSPPSYLVSSFVRLSRFFSTPTLRHLAMKPSAALTVPRHFYWLPAFLGALGHSTVSIPNHEREVSVSLFDSEYRHDVYQASDPRVFPGRPGAGFSLPASVPNITRRFSRSDSCAARPTC